MQDTFKTLSEKSFGEFRDRGSKFLAYAFPVDSAEECQFHLEALKKEHSKAGHWCYAYRLGLDKNNFRTNDDGEPSGTAGRPILGQIDSFELSNIFVVVVRYWGGTKLGTSGLKNAYKTSTQEALKSAAFVEKIVTDRFRLKFDYAIMSNVMNAVKRLKLEILSQNFDANPSIDIGIRKSEIESSILNLKARIAGVPIEMAMEMKQVEHLEIEEVVEN